jgi:ATP-dependent helicase/nuclease subunit B
MTPESHVFALPPGVDFPKALVAGMIARMAGEPPEAMARVRLFVNTTRMSRRIRDVFSDHGARFLPRLRLVTDIGRDPLAGLPAAVPPLRRRLELARLVAELAARQPDFAPGAGLYALADSLADLLAEMQMEGVPLEALERPDIAENHAEHWQRSLQFIRIVARYFDADSPPDAEARQRRVVEAMTAEWASAPPDHPVFVAGSTGSRGATSVLMQAVARLPKGAVVLPGFDFEMPDSGWSSLDSGSFPCEDHPQYRFAALLRALEVPAAAVRHWVDDAPPSRARNALVSLAMQPAPVTDQWMREGKKLGDLVAATQQIALIEAPDPRAEALALALILREAAETGTRAALVTPDRVLTRRVAAALDRWGITADDSAGQPLSLTPPGRFLRHVAGLLGRKLTVEALFVLLKHPLTATGAEMRGPHLRYSRELELHLRRYGPAFPDAAALIEWAKDAGEADRLAWAEWLAAAFAPCETWGTAPLSNCLDTHLACAGMLAAGPGGTVDASELWREAAGRESARIVAEIRREAAHGGSFSPAQYSDLLTTLLQATSVRNVDPTHPRIAIWGTLEARVQGAELVLLAGLNEGVWPHQPNPDPWLSRKMRLDSGLLLPERQVGLAAHDFQQAIAAPQVVLSRAARSADAETVGSRWLARLTNLLDGLPEQNGQHALREMRARGQLWLERAAALDAPGFRLPPAQRPAPRPPVSARPRVLPVTAIKTLIRDPYAVYARRILRLYPLDPLRPEPDPLRRGQVLHKIVETFVAARPDAETEGEARQRLLHAAEQVLRANVPWPTAQRLWLTRIERIAANFAAAEVERANKGVPVVLEKKGSIRLKVPDFTLTATPDRIDLLHDGRVHIYDYKSGKPPSQPEMRAFDKQLLLEAAMAERGAFAPLGARDVAGYSYIQLGGEGAETSYPADPDLIMETWTGLHQLAAAYLRAETGFASRRSVQKADERGDYDHLARFGEWDMTDESIPGDVG